MLDQFVRADGTGYDFLADFVIALDKRNPQDAPHRVVRCEGNANKPMPVVMVIA